MEIIDIIYHILWFSLALLIIIIVPILLFPLSEVEAAADFEVKTSLDQMKGHQIALIYMKDSFHSDLNYSRMDAISMNYILNDFSTFSDEIIESSGLEVCANCEEGEADIVLEDKIVESASDFSGFAIDDRFVHSGIRIPDMYGDENRRGMAMPLPTHEGVESVYFDVHVLEQVGSWTKARYEVGVQHTRVLEGEFSHLEACEEDDAESEIAARDHVNSVENIIEFREGSHCD